MQLKFLEVQPKKRLYPVHLQDLPNVALSQQLHLTGFLEAKVWASLGFLTAVHLRDLLQPLSDQKLPGAK